MSKLNRLRKRRRLPPGVGVPRRFGLDRIMLFTLLLAVLFGSLQWIGANPIVFSAFGLFVVGVGASQAVLFGGRRPRRASVLSGAVLGPLLGFVVLAGSYKLNLMVEVRDVIDTRLTAIALAMSGAPLGYLFGGLIAGMFLAKDRDLEKDDPTTPPLESELSTECPKPVAANERNRG